jgi:hypothetical protein
MHCVHAHVSSLSLLSFLRSLSRVTPRTAQPTTFFRLRKRHLPIRRAARKCCSGDPRRSQSDPQIEPSPISGQCPTTLLDQSQPNSLQHLAHTTRIRGMQWINILVTIAKERRGSS